MSKLIHYPIEGYELTIPEPSIPSNSTHYRTKEIQKIYDLNSKYVQFVLLSEQFHYRTYLRIDLEMKGENLFQS